MRTLLHTFIFSICLFLTAQAQVVTTQPAFPTADAEVTLTIDLKLATDSRAKALLGKTDDVYLWSGAGTSETGNAFEFQPAGQTNFSAPFAPGKMTALGNDRWQIKLVPRTYFGVPSGRPIRKLGLLLKSGNGQAQTEDLQVIIYDDSFNLSRLSPNQKNFYVDANLDLLVRYKTSRQATFSLTLDGQPTPALPTGDSVRTTLNTGTQAGVRRMAILRATATAASAESAADTFYFTVKPQPTIAALPSGLQDGINYTAANRGETKVTLVLYAPKKSFVYLLGEFNDWTVSPAYLMNRTPDGNRYWLEVSNLPTGETAFQYLVDGTIPVGDPYADKVLDRNNDRFITPATYPNLKLFPEKAQGNVVSVLQPAQAPFTFTTNFQRPAVNTLVVYELLVRDFSASQTFKAVQDSLPYLKRLGINTIELMPVMEFSGNNSWGYNPIYYFAPDKAYGTKNDLKRLIDEAHKQGIAVVLDMVLNQADYEFPYVKMYWDGNRPSADSPFFNQQATHPFSVFFDFNHESADTKAFVDRVCRYWLQDYRFDGFRFDLSKGFTQKNTGDNVGAWGAYDASRVAIWKRIYDQIRAVDPTAYVILEHFAENTEERELADYGMLFWGNHNGDYRSAARSGQGNLSGISYQQRNFRSPNLIGYAESHDEERLVYDLRQNGQTQGSYSIKNLPTALDRAKLAAAFLLTVPGPKMLWQFGELGYDASINTCPNGSISDGCRTDPKPVRWNYYQEADRRKLYNVYAELIKLKTTVPAFASTDFSTDFANPVKRLTLRSSSGTVFLLGNFDARAQTVNAGFPSAGTWYHYFTGQPVTITDAEQSVTLEPGAFHLYTTSRLPTPPAGLVPFALVPSPVTASEPDASGQITVSPNPVDNQMVIDVTSSYRGLVEFNLLNAGGRSIQTVRSQKSASQLRQPLDLHTLPTGSYLLRVQQGDRQRTVTVLKR
ncbi:alpha-amylase family glycosyl hydrolase [Spirosoma sp. 209]|nr:alpha-amylase family glycosyl hydrolase [Spirosoma sp. 209]